MHCASLKRSWTSAGTCGFDQGFPFSVQCRRPSGTAWRFAQGGEAWRARRGGRARPIPFALCRPFRGCKETGGRLQSRSRVRQPGGKPNGVVTLSRSRPARGRILLLAAGERGLAPWCRGFGRPDVARSRAGLETPRYFSAKSAGAVPSSPSPYPVGRGCRQVQPSRSFARKHAELTSARRWASSARPQYHG